MRSEAQPVLGGSGAIFQWDSLISSAVSVTLRFLAAWGVFRWIYADELAQFRAEAELKEEDETLP
jgi:hypothetical protein